MFFVVVFQWIDCWYKLVLLPVLKTPYTYILIGLTGALAFIVSMLFVFAVDYYRLLYRGKHLVKEVAKSAGMTMIVTTLLISLYDLALYFGATSQFFKHQSKARSKLGVFGVDGGFCSPSTFGQNPLVVKKIITLIFLVMFPFITTYFVSQVMYQVHRTKDFLIYFGLMILVSIICYAIVVRFNFI